MGKAFKISPTNILSDFGYVESWAAGTSVAPDGWFMEGTAGSVARESTIVKRGTYSMKIISGGSNSYKAIRSLDSLDMDNYSGFTIKFGMWVTCDTASKARVLIRDGISTTYSSYHTGSNAEEWLEVEHQVDLSNTELSFGAEVQGNAVTAYFDGGVAVRGETIFTELQEGNVYAREQDWQSQISFSVTSFNVPRQEGTVIDNVKFKEKRINIKVQVHNDDIDASRTLFDNLLLASAQGEKDLFLQDDRLVKVRLNNMPRIRHDADLKVHTFTLGFIAADPFQKYIAALRKKDTSPTTFDVAYNGNVSSQPIIYIIPAGGTLSTATLENKTSGERFSFTGDVGAGLTLEVDSNTLEVKNNEVDGQTDYSGDFISLIPGTNYFKYTGDGCTILVDWVDQWA